jgi:NAD(P)-binding Rossmann-like domain/Maltose operon periplasmic protein precursor (MalM)
MIIIGAGIAGLSTGRYAQMNGYQTTIFEMHTIPGGLCTAWRRDGYTFDINMHNFIGSRPSPYTRMWEKLGVLKGRRFHYHREMGRIEGRGKRLDLSIDPRQLEEQMLALSPENADLTREFIGLLTGKNIVMGASLCPVYGQLEGLAGRLVPNAGEHEKVVPRDPAGAVESLHGGAVDRAVHRRDHGRALGPPADRGPLQEGEAAVRDGPPAQRADAARSVKDRDTCRTSFNYSLIVHSICTKLHEPKNRVPEKFLNPLMAWKIAGLPHPEGPVISLLEAASRRGRGVRETSGSYRQARGFAVPGFRPALFIVVRIMERGKLRIYFILSLMLFFASCAASHPQAMDSLREAQECCQSMAGFPYEPLLEGKRVDFHLDASSPAFRFETGKSFFKAFSLPKKQVPYYVRIRSFALGETIRNAHIFYPQLVLLDEHYTVVARNEPAAVFVTKAGPMETASVSWTALGIKFEDSLPVERPDARYVVIYTSDFIISALSFRTAPSGAVISWKRDKI